MAKSIVYPNLALSGVVGPQTLAGGAGQKTTNSVPIKGAARVVFRYKTTTNIAPSAWGILIGNNTLRTHAMGVTGYPTANGNIGLRSDQGGGNVLTMCPPTGYNAFPNDFAQFQITANVTGGQDMLNLTVDAEVWYSDDAYIQAQDAGQANYVVPTT